MQNFKDQFYLNFIKDDRWQYLADGLKTTLLITFFAVILGLVLGFLAAIVRSSAVRGGIRKPPHMKEKGVWLWKLAGYDLSGVPDGDPRNAHHDPVADHVLCHLRKRQY